jgi:hypothetical protein
MTGHVYYRLILANIHFMLKSIKNYSFCVKLEPATILVDKTMDLTPVICSIVVIIGNKKLIDINYL